MAKKTTGGTKTKPRRQQTGAAKTKAATVRMYKLQLGDCFLLSFPKDRGGEFHLLIDCGLIQGAENPDEVLKGVAKDVAERTGGALDLVLVTHEHWDHVSGFAQARDEFSDIDFKELWLAWTEDPKDELANRLRGDRDKRRRTLEMAIEHQRGLTGAAPNPGVQLAECLMAFSGGVGAAGKTKEALDWVKGHADKTRYCRPGDLLTLPGVSSARVYVLGPPEDETLLHRSAPSRKSPETYLASAEEQLGFLLAGEAGAETAQPFDRPFRVEREEARSDEFFQKHYGFGDAAESWRRIDTDWLGAAGPLALQLDSDTNNTSLAIAVELLPSGKVLLFPGDAQVGNWLSWQNLSWSPAEGNGGAKVTVNDLFKRTVLYKVGHHGSHNATLREKGLELMTGGELTALVPVIERFANEKKHWPMPWPDLFKRLRAVTGGRVMCADQANGTAHGATVTEDFIEMAIPV